MLRKSIVLAFSAAAFLTMAIALPPAVTIKEWDLPTPNSRPHDPALAPDGSLWYTGVVRNMVATGDGNLYMACSGVNKLGIAEIG